MSHRRRSVFSFHCRFQPSLLTSAELSMQYWNILGQPDICLMRFTRLPYVSNAVERNRHKREHNSSFRLDFKVFSCKKLLAAHRPRRDLAPHCPRANTRDSICVIQPLQCEWSAFLHCAKSAPESKSMRCVSYSKHVPKEESTETRPFSIRYHPLLHLIPSPNSQPCECANNVSNKNIFTAD